MSQGQPRRSKEGWERDQGRGGGRDRPAVAGGHVAMWTDKITVGEALEATARSAGDRPIEQHDAAAIAAAEATATGVNVVVPGGLADAARLAADANTVVRRDEFKTKLGEVLGDAVTRIPADKEVTREDAARVARTEIRTSPDQDTRPGGVADLVAAARPAQRAFLGFGGWMFSLIMYWCYELVLSLGVYAYVSIVSNSLSVVIILSLKLPVLLIDGLRSFFKDLWRPTVQSNVQ